MHAILFLKIKSMLPGIALKTRKKKKPNKTDMTMF